MSLLQKILLYLNKKFLTPENADFSIANIENMKFKLKEQELDLKVLSNALDKREIAILKREESLLLAEIELEFKTNELQAQAEILEKSQIEIGENIKINELIYTQLATEHAKTSGSSN